MGPLDWHVHELIFGYVAAVITGFLLTAIPNWTGRLPVCGLPRSIALLQLAGLAWIAAFAGFILSFGPLLVRQPPVWAGRR